MDLSELFFKASGDSSDLARLLRDGTPSDSELRQASLVDHEWIENGLVNRDNFEPKDQSNNIKDELEIQWGRGHIDTAYSNEDESKAESGVAERLNPADGAPIIFARDLMNQGHMGSSLTRQLRSRFTADTLRASEKGLKDLFKLSGAIGCIAVDSRGYKSAKDAVKALSTNPNKHFVKYIITDKQADSLVYMPSGDGQSIDQEGMIVSDNVIDDFMASDSSYTPETVAFCNDTMMPVFSGSIDDSEVNSLLAELVEFKGLDSGVANTIISSSESNLEKVQAAFISINNEIEASSVDAYSDRVDASEFMMESSSKDVEFFGKVSNDLVDVEMEMIGGVDVSERHAGVSILDIDAQGSIGDAGVKDFFSTTAEVDIQHQMTDISVGDRFVAADVNVDQISDRNFINGDFTIKPKAEPKKPLEVSVKHSFEW